MCVCVCVCVCVCISLADSIEVLYTPQDSVKQDTLACLSESTGHTQYYLVCSRQSRLQDIRDVIKAAVLTGTHECHAETADSCAVL